MPLVWIRCFQSLSHVLLFATPWTVAHQAPLSMGFFRQEYWSGLPFPPPGDLSDPGIEPRSPVLKAYFLPLSHQGRPVWVQNLVLRTKQIVFFGKEALSLASGLFRKRKKTLKLFKKVCLNCDSSLTFPNRLLDISSAC